VRKLSLSEQLLLLSGIPLLALLVFAGLLAARTWQTWCNVEQTVALGRVINAVEEYTHAIPGRLPCMRAFRQRACAPMRRWKICAARPACQA
jgi:hypothetical protein